MDVDKLLEMKKIFKKENNINNNLNMVVGVSVTMLKLNEFACCNFGVNISKIKETDKYKQTIKSVLLKFLIIV
jgi:hypothetical protein